MKRNQLTGLWHTPDTDSLYHKTDSVTFYLWARKWADTEECQTIAWDIGKRTFKLSERYHCSEPGKATTVIGKEKLLIRKRDYGQVIQLTRGGKTIDHFKVLALTESTVNDSPNPIKQLKLLRFDKLEDQRLFQHVDSLVYQALNYSPEFSVSNGPKISKEDATNYNIRIRDYRDPNPKPLLVVNGIPTENYDVLKAFRLVETIEISYLTKERAASLYGYRALNGVIIVTISSKKFRRHFPK